MLKRMAQTRYRDNTKHNHIKMPQVWCKCGTKKEKFMVWYDNEFSFVSGIAGGIYNFKFCRKCNPKYAEELDAIILRNTYGNWNIMIEEIQEVIKRYDTQ